MNKNTETQEATPLQSRNDAAAEPQMIPVLTHFDRAELDAMKEETGAVADATAVACFVRKNLRNRSGQ